MIKTTPLCHFRHDLGQVYESSVQNEDNNSLPHRVTVAGKDLACIRPLVSSLAQNKDAIHVSYFYKQLSPSMLGALS